MTKKHPNMPRWIPGQHNKHRAVSVVRVRDLDCQEAHSIYSAILKGLDRSPAISITHELHQLSNRSKMLLTTVS